MGTELYIDSEAVATCALTVEVRDYPDNGDVVALIAARAAEGWIQTTSRAFLASEFETGAGAVVSAELVVDAQTTIHIRRSGSVWRTWTYTERAGETHRAENVRREGIRPVEALHYRVYWQLVAPTAFDAHGIQEWRPVASRLASMTIQQEKK